MSTPFSGSRLANFREKRQSQVQKIPPTNQYEQPLTLPQQQDNAYQPSISINAGRTATRFLKGRIQKPSNIEKTSSSTIGNEFSLPNKQNSIESKFALKLNEPDSDLRLVLNDSPDFDKKKQQVKLTTQPTQQKRILIQRRQSQQVKPQIKQQPVTKTSIKSIDQQVIAPKKQQISEQTIRQQQIQQSNQLDNQNELIECPQGCGRKFNRKALQKHSKACKLVFMSKRKQFNSQAKRVTSQQQANIVKQNKLQQKKAQLGKTKGKGFDKTSDNWKAASQDFRSAIKAVKKEGGNEDEEMKIMPCEFCEKPFAEVLLPKHLQNCLKRKQKLQKQKKKTKK